MDNSKSYFVSRDAKGKYRVAHVDHEWDEENKCFRIKRWTGSLHGKLTEQPDIEIYSGKAKRTLSEQCQLQRHSTEKGYTDKGYKQVDKDPEEYSESELLEVVGKEITGAQGICKPQLAKQADKVTNKKVFDKEYYASRKIDGLRCLIYLGADGKLHTSSRGAMNYDAALVEILTHPILIKLFKKNPWLILDGECYHHGISLERLNGYARTQKTANDYSVLQFYWYDIVDTNRSFEERLKRMLAIKEALKLGFDPEREFRDGELRIQFVPQELVSGWDNMMEMHNKFVAEGWEGLVIRNKDDTYGPNKRTNSMIKIKCYKSDEFIITGYELGLRGNEDMVFICETADGQSFKAKPHGDRAQKDWYVENFDTECLNHYAIVKYFYYSDTGIPLQPSVAAVRIDEDMPQDEE